MSLVRTRKLQQKIRSFRNPEKAKILAGFFKTGPGQYAEGDQFLGLPVPLTRKIISEYRDLDLKFLRPLLCSKFHEERLAGVLILVHQFQKTDDAGKRKIYRFYLSQKHALNNWDLIDLSAPWILGYFDSSKDQAFLEQWARHGGLWERRMAMLAGFGWIRRNDFAFPLQIAAILRQDAHDLIQKAVGWMLREIGKRDQEAEEKFLKQYAANLPRTMLRYAIERFPETKHLEYLLQARTPPHH